ncbi:MAG: hypothetical protein QE487_17325 [Fluviicola sp.]|nr:hypothetical protein [Fluviicola sp.]
MKTRSNILRKGLLVAIMIVLLFPLVQTLFPVFDLKPLDGVIEEAPRVELTVSNWLDESYQKSEEKYLTQHFGFREFLIRLHHQIDYTCFDKINAPAVFEGQNGYLYDRKHLDAYLGRDFIGDVLIKDQVTKLRFIQDQLAPYHKSVIVVLAPGKASFYPEFLPKGSATQGYYTNIRGYLNELKSQGINYIDLYHYLKNEKKKATYPLFAKYGIHWSHYGAALANDSITSYLEHLYGVEIVDNSWSGVSLHPAYDTDIDLLVLLNLMKNPPLPEMAYPNIREIGVKERSKLPVLAIGDSYFWGIDRFFSRCFSNYHFWSYNMEVFPESSYSAVATYQLDLKEQLAKHDVILILATDANLSDLGWGFIDKAEKVLRDPATKRYLNNNYNRKLEFLKQGMRGDKNWMGNIAKKAAEKHISLDSMLTLDAQWVLHQYEVK